MIGLALFSLHVWITTVLAGKWQRYEPTKVPIDGVAALVGIAYIVAISMLLVEFGIYEPQVIEKAVRPTVVFSPVV